MKYYPISNFKAYPEAYISSLMLKVVKKDGLIVPLLLLSNTEIHPNSLEKFEAFRRLALESNNEVTTIIGVEISELSKEELIDEGLRT